MKTVWKFQLEPRGGRRTFNVPDGFPLFVGTDPAGHLCVWMQISDKAIPKPMSFVVVGTGHPVPEDEKTHWVGSATMGNYVWHVYEYLPPFDNLTYEEVALNQ